MNPGKFLRRPNKKKRMGSLGFILTLLGSCIGLGNIWRFPYLLEQDGGGAFLLAFLVAIIVIGLPIFILETGIGGKYRLSPVTTWKRLTKRESFGSIGWLAISVLSVIIIYYSVVFAWSVTTFFHAFDYHIWENAARSMMNGGKPKSFAPNDPIKKLSDLGQFQWIWFIMLFLVWLLTTVVVWKGITGSVEKINKITIPIKLLLIFTILIYCLTLTGASSGINNLFHIKTSSLKNIKTWNDAFSQVFFSSSIAIGIIFAFSKHSKKNQEVNLTSSTIIFVNGLVALMIAVLVYSMLGWYANARHKTINVLLKTDTYFSENIAGPGLLFNLIPLVLGQLNINSHHVGGSLIGIGFFLAVLLATFTCFVASIVSISENFIISFKHYPKWLVFLLTLFPASFFSIFLCFKNSSPVILSIDHFINTYLYIASGLFEALIFGYLIKKTVLEKETFFIKHAKTRKSKFLYFIKSPDEANSILDYNNKVSAFKINKKVFIWFIRTITVPVIIFIMIYGIVNDFSSGYYSSQPKITLIIGLLIGLVVPIIQIIIYSLLCPKINNYFKNKKHEKR